MATATNVVRTLTIRGRSEGVDQTAQQVRSLGAAYGETAAASAKLERASLSLADVQARQQRAFDQAIRNQRMFASANENLARSYSAANDNAAQSSRSVLDLASHTASMVSHLKLAAVAAYAISPAFRAMVAGGVTASLGLLGANAGIVSLAMSRIATAAAPALAFFARLTIPITIAVAAFRLLSDTIERGTSLLEKYGSISGQRALFGSGVDESLAKLTRLQDETLSAEQVQRATELGARLEEAKRTIGEFFKVSLDLTDPALKLQSAWVKIVESVAKALELAGKIPDAFSQAANAIGNSSIWNKLNFGINLPGASPDQILGRLNAQLNAQNGAPELSTEEALRLARGRLAAGMGGGFVGRFNQSITDIANPPKLDKPEEIKSTADAWTRYAEQVTKATAALTANAQTVGLGARAHEQLRIQLQGEAILERDGVKDTDERRAALQRLAQAAGEAAEAVERARVSADIKRDQDTMFLSPADVEIANRLRGLYGNDIPRALGSSEAAAMRLNIQMRSVNDIIKGAGEALAKGFVSNLMQGKSAMDSMVLSARNLSNQLANQAITELFKLNFAGPPTAAVGAVQSNLFGAKAPQKKSTDGNDQNVGTEYLKAA